ncbi:MAG TPA: helix-turn-helix domain-containing protein [Woeseiaceae bacterium]
MAFAVEVCYHWLPLIGMQARLKQLETARQLKIAVRPASSTGGEMLESHYWTTDHVDSRARLDFWNSALRESMYELHFEARDSRFEAELRQHKVGPLTLSHVAVTSGHTVTRSRTDIARSAVSRFHLNYVQSGIFTVAQRGKQVTLAPGECVLLDSREPYRVESTERTAHICVHLPLDWLQNWIPHPEHHLVRPVRRGVPWSTALAASLNDAHLIADTSHSLHRLCADQLAGALALALGPAADCGVAGNRKIYDRVIETIAEMSHDPELDACSVAASMSISPRYLYKVLARENTTYSRELLRNRLERAARMLRDGRFDDLSIAEIAWRSGFRDPSHFSKRFRQTYHCTPGSFRCASHN